jgi:hypothetical protein
VELEIRPEPTDEERDALEAAVAGAGLETPRPAAYDSPWRAAALGEGAERDVRDP